MKVAVKYMAQLKHAAGVASEQLELEEPCSMRDFIQRLAARRAGLKSLLLDAAGGLQPTVLLFVGDQQFDPELSLDLRDGDVVTVLSPMAGG